MFNNLIKLAKNEEIPDFNIVDKTLLIIRNKKIVKNRVNLLPMGLIASLSSIAASIIIFFSINTYKEINDPYATFFVPVQIESPINILY